MTITGLEQMIRKPWLIIWRHFPGKKTYLFLNHVLKLHKDTLPKISSPSFNVDDVELFVYA